MVTMAEDREVLQLWRACYSGNTDTVQQLLDQDVDYTVRDRNGETVLHMAARSDHADVLNILLDHLEPDLYNHNHQTSLHLASIKGHVGVVNVLLLADCDIDRQTKFSEMTALHLACRHNSPAVVSALLEGGAVCNIPDTIGKIPEFYTSEPEIHKLFTLHAKVCQHYDKTHTKNTTTTTKNRAPKHINDEDSDEASPNPKHRKQSDRARQLWNKLARNEKKLKIDHGLDFGDKHQGIGRNEIVHNDKKVKINHGHGFSDEHKQRMSMNVFDRLMGGGKTKKK